MMSTLVTVFVVACAVLPLHFVNAGSASVAASHRAPPLPTGLDRAIHAQLGDGPIGLGTAPLVTGIVPTRTGWTAKAAAESITAAISPTGSVRASRKGSASVGLAPVSLSEGGTSTRLSVHSSSLTDGALSQNLGPLMTTYRVTGGGIEQTFSIAHRQDLATGPLVIGLASGVRWTTSHNASDARPVLSDSGRLAYSGLRTTDADGRALRSHFVAGALGLHIVIDDAGAVYPLTVDPTWTSTSTPTANLSAFSSAPTGSYFGFSVALSADGTTALVGSPDFLLFGTGPGEAYIFHTSSANAWSSTTTATATLSHEANTCVSGTNGAECEEFGYAVALTPDGTAALIGAPFPAGQSGSPQAAAFVFTSSSESSWTSSSTPDATLTDGNSTTPTDEFGASVTFSSDGTTALIGAPHANSDAGAAYIYQVASESSWTSTSTPTAELTNGAGTDTDGLGCSVALSPDGTTALVGAPQGGQKAPLGIDECDNFVGPGPPGTGAVDVYHVSTEDGWSTTSTPTAILTDGAGADGDGLGSSVAVSADGTTALVGAPGVNNGTGAAYIFNATSESSWATTSTPTATLTNSAGASADFLGSAVALAVDGSTALVAANDVDGNLGAVYVFQVTSESAWSTTSTPGATLTPSSPESDFFGSSVAFPFDGAAAFDSTIALIGNNLGVTAGIYEASSTPPPTHTLSVSDAGTGNGTVTSSPGGIDCGSTCSASFPSGQNVTLSAAPTSGSTFAGWSGGMCSGTGSCEVTLDEDTSVTATFNLSSSQPATPPTTNSGYWEVAADGGVFTFGHDNFFGSMGGRPLNAPVVGMASTADRNGYWLVASDGGVFAFGDANFFGSEGGTHLDAPVVGMAPTPDGGGYWLVASDGGVFAFGNARSYGSESGKPLNAPVVAMAETGDANGYWLVASDGTVIPFGDAESYGSEAGSSPHAPIIGISATTDGKGYWLVGSDGAVFSFGDAVFFGSEGGKQLNAPVVGLAGTTDGDGYWLDAQDGGIFTFGDAQFFGSMGGKTLNAPMVSMAS